MLTQNALLSEWPYVNWGTEKREQKVDVEGRSRRRKANGKE